MKKKIFKIIKWIIAFTILYFLLDYFIKNFNQVDWSILHFNYYFLLIGIFFIVLSNVLWPILWWLLVKRMGFKFNLLRACWIFFVSQVGRYVPGKALLVLTRTYLTEKQDIGRKEAFTSVILDLALFSLSGVLLFVIFLPFYEALEGWLVYVSIGLVLMFFILVHPKILEFLINIVLRIFKKELIKLNLSYGFILFLVVLHTFRWFIHGIGLFFLLKSIIEIPFVLFWLIPGIVSASIVFGMIVLLAPGGLGIREGLIVLLLSPFVISNIAILFSVLARLLLSVVEVILLGIFYIVKKRKKIIRFLFKTLDLF